MAAFFATPRRENDGLVERLTAAILRHPDVDFASLSDEELEGLLGRELADFYRERIRVGLHGH